MSDRPQHQRVQHIVSFSGGKDSGACIELALMRGAPFRAIMCDTGNESQITLDHAAAVSRRLEREIGRPLEIIRADFSEQIARKRQVIQTKWRAEGVAEGVIERALTVLTPTGNPFLDLCIWKGRFPSRMAQFCTEELKANVAWRQVIQPALYNGPVVQWLGVRRDESAARSGAPMIQAVRTPGLHKLTMYRPIIHWTAQNVISFAKARGAPINPLYRMGMSRVGCFPCIHSNKNELANLDARFPDAIARIEEWEAVVAMVSKRQSATFFAPGKTPLNSANGQKYLGVRDVVGWARSGKGGRQRDFLRELELDEPSLCSSQYGLCE